MELSTCDWLAIPVGALAMAGILAALFATIFAAVWIGESLDSYFRGGLTKVFRVVVVFTVAVMLLIGFYLMGSEFLTRLGWC